MRRSESVVPPAAAGVMYWFLDMADREIAEYMSMARRAGTTHREGA